MAKWHICELRKELKQLSFNIFEEPILEDDRYTEMWLLNKGNQELIILFEGYDEDGVFEFERSFGCHLKKNTGVALHLPKHKPKPSKPKAEIIWREELKTFTEKINQL